MTLPLIKKTPLKINVVLQLGEKTSSTSLICLKYMLTFHLNQSEIFNMHFFNEIKTMKMGKISIFPIQEKYLLINKPYLINILQKKRKKEFVLYILTMGWQCCQVNHRKSPCNMQGSSK